MGLVCMTLTFLDLLSISSALFGVLLLIVSLLAIFAYLSARSERKRFERQRKETHTHVNELQKSIDNLIVRISDGDKIDESIVNRLNAKCRSLKDVEDALEPDPFNSSSLPLEVADEELDELDELFAWLDEQSGLEAAKEADEAVDPRSEIYDVETDIAPYEVEIYITDSKESGGCAFLGEFDYATFRITKALPFEPTHSEMNDAIYEKFDANLQSFKKINNVWHGELGFIL